MLKWTAKWSFIPDVVETLDTLLGNEDNNKSKVLLEAGRVGNMTCCVREKLSSVWRSFLLCRAFFKDFPVGGAFFEKGPFCEIIY
jgi:hypothetical protein